MKIVPVVRRELGLRHNFSLSRIVPIFLITFPIFLAASGPAYNSKKFVPVSENICGSQEINQSLFLAKWDEITDESSNLEVVRLKDKLLVAQSGRVFVVNLKTVRKRMGVNEPPSNKGLSSNTTEAPKSFTEVPIVGGLASFKWIKQDEETAYLITPNEKNYKFDATGKSSDFSRKNRILVFASNPNIAAFVLQEPKAENLTFYSKGRLPIQTNGSINPIPFDSSELDYLPIITFEPSVIWFTANGSNTFKSQPMIGERVTAVKALSKNQIAVGTDRGKIYLHTYNKKPEALETEGGGITSIAVFDSGALAALDSHGKVFLFKKPDGESGKRERSISGYRLSSTSNMPLVVRNGQLLIATPENKIVVLNAAAEKVKEVALNTTIRSIRPFGKSGFLVVAMDELIVLNNAFEKVYETKLKSGELKQLTQVGPEEFTFVANKKLHYLDLNTYKNCLK